MLVLVSDYIVLSHFGDCPLLEVSFILSVLYLEMFEL